MLDKIKAVRIIKTERDHACPRLSYVFLCSYSGCANFTTVRQDALKTSSGKCRVHSHVKRPYESIYRRLFNDWRKPIVDLTYEQFLSFVKIKNCCYCGDHINRVPFATVKGKFSSAAYFLDRKDAKKPYSTQNCVVCCTQCNFLKGNRFTYTEFLCIGDALAAVRLRRKRKYLNL